MILKRTSKGFMSALSLTLLATTTANAQAIDGDWQGTLTAGPGELRLVLHLTPDGNGGFAATLDSPDQGVLLSKDAEIPPVFALCCQTPQSRPRYPCRPTVGSVTEVLMRSHPLIAVTDVEASSRWYQRLLGCQSAHGGTEYERLVSNGALILQLHRFEVEHHHGSIGNPDDRPYGNGVLLWFEIDDFDAAIVRVAELKAEMILPRHRNPTDGNGGPNHWECWLRDPDGYTVVLASPDGSADGNWKP